MGESLNLDVITAVLCHPAGLRRIALGLAECLDAKTMNDYGIFPNTGYGRPSDYQLPGTDYYFSKAQHVKSLADAKRLALEIATNIRDKHEDESNI
jgi:hypothetical protein